MCLCVCGELMVVILGVLAAAKLYCIIFVCIIYILFDSDARLL